MFSYLIRRLLLFVPTMLGATFIIFMVMALSPINIVDVLLPPSGEMQPGIRAEREAYIEERYGLDAPPVVQYLRWLNNISPVGLHTWKRDDPEVVPAREARQQFREETLPVLRALFLQESDRQLRRRMKTMEAEQNFGPLPGEVRWDKLPFKWPDLGYSYIQGRPVGPIILETLPITLLLSSLSLPLATVVALLTGIWAAKNRGRWQDWGLGSTLLMLSSLPVIWVGVMLIGYFANVEYFRLFPAAGLHDLRAETMPFLPRFGETFQRGYLLDSLWHLALPVLCLTYGTFAYLSKLTRTSLLETLGADYVRTARAKGVPEKQVLYRHAFRNALIPLITVAAGILPAMVTGAIIVETIFSIRGMGRLVFASLNANDRELFLSVSLFTLILQLLGFLIADVLYVIADPRVSYAKQ